MLWRQCISAVLLALFAYGCSEPPPPTGVVGHVRTYFGGIAADEPEAVLIARDVLSAGGSAVDAVVSMGLTMMVTRPDAAGPGGGGMCIAFDAEGGKGEAIEFLPHAPKSQAPAGQWLAALPGSFRGLFLLHARYGQLRWEQLVLPAERLARFGVRVPRIVTKALAGPARSALKGNRARAIYFGGSGTPLVEGDVLRQVDLAATLGRIRIAGPGEFYSGPLARKFADGVRRAGGWLTVEDLRSYRPRWMSARMSSFGPHDVFFLPVPAGGGPVAGEIWSKLGDKGLYANSDGGAGDATRATKFIAAARHGYATAAAASVHDTATVSAGALAVDRLGNSAACVLTLNHPFGSGHVAGDTGVIPAKPVRTQMLGALSAMIVANRHTKQTFLAATGAGDQYASTAMMEVVLRVLDGKVDIEAAQRAARISLDPPHKSVLAEPAIPIPSKAALGGESKQVNETPRLGQVNVMFCPDGVVELPRSCAVRTDPRGFGHAINAEF